MALEPITGPKPMFRLGRDEYVGLHKRYDALLGGHARHFIANKEEEDKKVRAMLTERFDNMMRVLFRQQGASMDISILASTEAQEFIGTHAAVLDSSFRQVGMSEAMRRRLTRSDYIFSGMKAFHELNEAFPSLLDSDGNRKPFEQFLNDVRKIDRTYNRNYLRAEYNFVQASAAMAAKWEEFAADGHRYHLQYRTAADARVRPAHAELHGITLPMTDTFWEDYWPPLSWGCRCTVVQVRKGKYPETPHDEAMERGEAAMQGQKHADMFRFNSGIKGQTVPDYNPYTIRRCRDCDIAQEKLKLAKTFIPDNELCAACQLLRRYNEETIRKLLIDIAPPAVNEYERVANGKVMISPWHGENERAENQILAEQLGKYTGAKIYLLPRLDPINPEQATLRNSLLPDGVFEGKNPDFYIGGMFFDGKSMMNIENQGDPDKWKSAIEKRIKTAKKQADNMIIEVPGFISRKVIHATVINYLNRSKKKRIIIIKWMNRFFFYDKK